MIIEDPKDYNFYPILEPIEEQSLQQGNSYRFVKKTTGKTSLGNFKGKNDKNEFSFANSKKTNSRFKTRTIIKDPKDYNFYQVDAKGRGNKKNHSSHMKKTKNKKNKNKNRKTKRIIKQ